MSRLGMQAIAMAVVGGMVLAAPPIAGACIWDSDTLAAEAKGMPEVVDVIVGRFDRNPPLYYRMRLERVTRVIEEVPDDLAAYDDAGVACDRLGRHDEAIEWMARKRERLDRLAADDPLAREHRYRYLANLGTFHAHRWVAAGADRSNLADLEMARDLIREAIELNPDAHFGREKYQLKAIEWLVEPPPMAQAAETTEPSSQPATRTSSGPLPDLIGLRTAIFLAAKAPDSQATLTAYMPAEFQMSDNPVLAKIGYADAVRGLSGLIVLGNAWESVDVYFALGVTLQVEGKSSPAAMALLRVEELVAQGRGSLHPEAPAGQALISSLQFHPLAESRTVSGFYRAARSAADARNAQRDRYMLARLEAGEHPDTHATFWADWREPQRPSYPSPVLNRVETRVATAIGVLLLMAVAASLLLIWLMWRIARRRSAVPSV